MSVTHKDLRANFKLSIHTSYFNNFFLLRTEVVINGQHAVVGSDGKGWLTLNSRYPEVGVTFDSLVTDVNSILQSHDMEGVTNYWCEEVPLFELKVSSQEDLKRLLRLEEKIKEELSSRIADRMAAQLQSPDASTPPPALHVLVQPHVYLLIPDSHRMDGRVIQVTKESIASCIALCAGSNVFDFGALFRAFRANPSQVDEGPKDLAELVYELTEVVDWYHLGLCLQVPNHQLQMIARDHPQDTKMCKTSMLTWWKDNTTEQMWSTIVQALVKTGSRVLACKIALKYGVPIPKVSQEKENAPTTAQETSQDQSSSLHLQLERKVRRLKLNIETKDQTLAQRDQSLKRAEQSKIPVAHGFQTIRQKLLVAQKRIAQLLHKKKHLEDNLEHKEMELQALRVYATDEKEKHERALLWKKEEIANLRKELATVTDELERMKSQLPSFQKELGKITLELAKKTTEVQMLREAKEEMKIQLEVEKKRVDDYLMQQTAASFSDAKYRMEVELQIQCLKDEAQKKSEEMKTLHKVMEENDVEMRRLAQLIKSQESQLQQMNDPQRLLTMDEHQLQRYLDILSDIVDLKEKLSDAEDERHSTATKVKVLQEESVYSQTHATSLVSESRRDPVTDECHATATKVKVLQEESVYSQTHATSLPQVQLLKWPLQFKWRRGKDLPFGVSGAHTVEHNGQIYIGGGLAGGGSNEYIGIQYDPDSGEYFLLPKSTARFFAMASVENQLLLAGGGEGSTDVQLLNSKRHRWTLYRYPRMPTGRSLSAAVGYKKYLIVACGDFKDTVEVLDCTTHQWYSAQPVPVGGHRMTAVTICDDIYISSYGWNEGLPHVFSAHLPTLISNATCDTTTSPIWQELPPPPERGPTLLALQSHLLLVGGRGRRKELYRYETEMKKWSVCGQLPARMWAPSCVVLPSGELFVAGGMVEGVAGHSQQVWIGSLE